MSWQRGQAAGAGNTAGAAQCGARPFMGYDRPQAPGRFIWHEVGWLAIWASIFLSMRQP